MTQLDKDECAVLLNIINSSNFKGSDVEVIVRVKDKLRAIAMGPIEDPVADQEVAP